MGGAARAADHPVAFPKNAKNMLTLGGLEVGVGGLVPLVFHLQFGKRGPQRGTGRKDHRTLHEVFEFANIPRPPPVYECLHGFGRDGFDPLAHALGVSAKEIAHQKRDILAALPKRRKGDGKNPQAIVQITAKLPGGNHLGEITVGGGDKADVHRNSSGAPNAFKLFFLQGP